LVEKFPPNQKHVQKNLIKCLPLRYQGEIQMPNWGAIFSRVISLIRANDGQDNISADPSNCSHHEIALSFAPYNHALGLNSGQRLSPPIENKISQKPLKK
jgi:hypothetical protein